MLRILRLNYQAPVYNSHLSGFPGRAGLGFTEVRPERDYITGLRLAGGRPPGCLAITGEDFPSLYRVGQEDRKQIERATVCIAALDITQVYLTRDAKLHG